jgi:hypothetical protein
MDFESTGDIMVVSIGNSTVVFPIFLVHILVLFLVTNIKENISLLLSLPEKNTSLHSCHQHREKHLLDVVSNINNLTVVTNMEDSFSLQLSPT